MHAKKKKKRSFKVIVVLFLDITFLISSNYESNAYKCQYRIGKRLYFETKNSSIIRSKRFLNRLQNELHRIHLGINHWSYGA